LRWVVWLGLGLTAGCWFPPPVVDAGDGDMDAGVDAGPEGPSIDTFTINSVNNDITITEGSDLDIAWSATADDCELRLFTAVDGQLLGPPELALPTTAEDTEEDVPTSLRVELTCNMAGFDSVTAEHTATVAPSISDLVIDDNSMTNISFISASRLVNEGSYIVRADTKHATECLLFDVTNNAVKASVSTVDGPPESQTHTWPDVVIDETVTLRVDCTATDDTTVSSDTGELLVRTLDTLGTTAPTTAPNVLATDFITWSGSELAGCAPDSVEGAVMVTSSDSNGGQASFTPGPGVNAITFTCADNDAFGQPFAGDTLFVTALSLVMSPTGELLQAYDAPLAITITTVGADTCVLSDAGGEIETLMMTGANDSNPVAFATLNNRIEDADYTVSCTPRLNSLTVVPNPDPATATLNYYTGPRATGLSVALDVNDPDNEAVNNVVLTATYDGVGTCVVNEYSGDPGPVMGSPTEIPLVAGQATVMKGGRGQRRAYELYCARSVGGMMEDDTFAETRAVWWGELNAASVGGGLASDVLLVTGNLQLGGYSQGVFLDAANGIPSLLEVAGFMNLSDWSDGASLTNGAGLVLTSIWGDLRIQQTATTQLTTTNGLGQLQWVGGDIEISGNDSLTTVFLPALTSVGQDVSLSGNDSLTTVSLPALTSVGQDVSLSGNDSLATVSLPALNSVEGDLTIEFNGLGTPLDQVILGPQTDGQALFRIDGDLLIENNTWIAPGGDATNPNDLRLNELDEIGGGLSIHTNPGLDQWSFGNLTTVQNSTPLPTGFTVFNNANLPCADADDLYCGLDPTRTNAAISSNSGCTGSEPTCGVD
jgi:hypothetical protein